MVDSTALGNAGEHLVMAHLLAQGFQAFMADRGNTAFDISCVDGRCHSLIRVKTTSSNMVKWSAKKDGKIFLDQRDEGDFVALVDLRNSVFNAPIYIVPSHVVATVLIEGDEYYHSFPKKDGTPRKRTKLRGVYLTGAPKPTDINWGYHKIWGHYLNAWDQLREKTT